VSNAQLFAPATENGVLRKGNFDLAYVPWTTGYDPDDSFMFSCSGSENYMDYCNDQMESLEGQALSARTQGARKAIYAQIEAKVARDVPIIFLFNPKYIYAYSNALQGFDPNPFGPTWNAYQWSANGP
jgi:peptide/nickel transport system substrate-binding protein